MTIKTMTTVSMVSLQGKFYDSFYSFSIECEKLIIRRMIVCS